MQTTDTDARNVALQRLEELRAAGKNPYEITRFPDTYRSGRTTELRYVQATKKGKPIYEGADVVVRGRVVSTRPMGGTFFGNIMDAEGRVQIYAKRDDHEPDAYNIIKHLKVGDHVGIYGTVFVTAKGEITVRIKELVLMSVSLRIPPIAKVDAEGNQHFGIADVEARYRQRYLDLMSNQEVRELFLRRSRALFAIRKHLEVMDFAEVHTPVLQDVAGGAAARPFITHHNKLDHDFKLRISLELPLKKLIIGGLERVYEIGPVFRNEGLSTRHNPEFMLLELYWAYADLDSIMYLTTHLLQCACRAMRGKLTWKPTPDAKYGYSLMKIRRRTMRQLVGEDLGEDITDLTDLAELRRLVENRIDPGDIDLDAYPTFGLLLEAVFEDRIAPYLIEPTFVTEFPIDNSPLAKEIADKPGFVYRFELYMGGMEIANAYGELNDPLDQKSRFEQQSEEIESYAYDADFITAMEYGMPPTGGLGIGLDRLFMLLSNSDSIKEVIAFPTLKPEKQD